jgi:septum site-determining protein MinC
LAGVKGNVKARIFCQSLEAELVSIAGCYRVMEEVETEFRGRPVHIFLSDNRLIIEPLTR